MLLTDDDSKQIYKNSTINERLKQESVKYSLREHVQIMLNLILSEMQQFHASHSS